MAWLLTFGLTWPQQETRTLIRSIYEEEEISPLPLVAGLATEVATILWIPALALELTGIVLACKGDRASASRLFFWMVFGIAALQILAGAAMVRPLITEQGL